MLFYVKLAARNIRRHTRRTILTGTTVVVGIGMLILGQAFIDGLNENILVSAVEGTTGHFTLRPKEYPDEFMQHPIDELVTLTPEARAFLDEQTTAWTGRIYFIPSAVAGGESMRVRAIGYDVKRDATVFPRDLWTVEGAYPDPAKDEILISRNVAKHLKVAVDDSLTLQVRTHTGALNALTMRVAGIVRTTHTTVDAGGILVPGPLAARLLNTPLWSHISARTNSRAQGLRQAEQITPLVGDAAEVITWESETADLIRLQEIRRRSLNFIIAILMGLAGFGMANTILMAAYERVREVGTLRAMGMTEGGVLRVFLFEGALMGFGGSILGCLWGGGLSLYWSLNPFDFSSAVDGPDAGFQFSTLIYTTFSPGMLATAIFFGVFVATLASIYPARVASRMLPADAVRA